MPVAVRLVEVLAIVALVATMAAGAAVIIFMEKCLSILLMVTDPLVSVITFFLGVLKYIFLVIIGTICVITFSLLIVYVAVYTDKKIIYKLTYVMEHLTTTLWESSSATASAASKCAGS